MGDFGVVFATEESDTTSTFAEINRAARTLATALQRLGVARGGEVPVPLAHRHRLECVVAYQPRPCCYAGLFSCRSSRFTGGTMSASHRLKGPALNPQVASLYAMTENDHAILLFELQFSPTSAACPTRHSTNPRRCSRCCVH